MTLKSLKVAGALEVDGTMSRSAYALCAASCHVTAAFSEVKHLWGFEKNRLSRYVLEMPSTFHLLTCGGKGSNRELQGIYWFSVSCS